MSDVQFENQGLGSYNNTFEEPATGLVGLMMKLGAKDKSQANLYLVVIGVVSICISVYFFWPSTPVTVKPPSQEELQRMSNPQRGNEQNEEF